MTDVLADESRDEWCFEFTITAAGRVAGRLLDESLWVDVIDWAETRGLGIGGGFRPASAQSGGAARSWHFLFGLCVQQVGRLIPASEASELERVCRGWCGGHGFTLAGGFRAFTDAERDSGE